MTKFVCVLVLMVTATVAFEFGFIREGPAATRTEAATSKVVAGGRNSVYCDMLYCERERHHTLCRYSSNEVNETNCGNIPVKRLTAKEQTEILDIHNELRDKVKAGNETRRNPGPQPAATELQHLKWDSGLAEIAQAWANQCEFAHDECRDTVSSYVGQNIGFTATSGPYGTTSHTELVKTWYNEVEKFNSRKVTSFTPQIGTGHYTQLVWAKSKFVGCGIVRYNNEKTENLNRTQLVCNYRPGGNVIGQPIYGQATRG